MSTSAYYNFIATNKATSGGGAHFQRQAAVSPSSFATSSSDSSSSLNQFSSLTATSTASSSSSSSSASSTTSNSTSNSLNSMGPQCRRASNRDLLRRSSITPTQTHHISHTLHGHTLQSLEPKPLKPFKTRSDYLEAMKEDLAEWLNKLYPDLHLTPDNFFTKLETGAIICRHANNVTQMGCNSMLVDQQQQLYLPEYNQISEPNNNNNSLASDSSKNSSISSHSSGLSCATFKSTPQTSPTMLNSVTKSPSDRTSAINWFQVKMISYRQDACPGTFFARDNICQFILWCRSLNIFECLLFETDDLVARKNEKSFILCLLEVARIGFKVGMPTPLIIQLEQEIDREIENDAKLQKQLAAKKCQLDQGDSDDSEKDDTIDSYGDDEDCTELKQRRLELDDTVNDSEIETKEEEPELEETKVIEKEQELGPQPQVITNDLVSLHEKVVQLLCQCTCPTQFPMVRVGDNGKYKVGDKLIIFVRILRRHIMVRVGGGWQELSEFLRVKDPCRSRLYQTHANSQHNQQAHPNVHHHPQLHARQVLSTTAVSRSRLAEISSHSNKGHHNFSSNGGQRLISGSASMGWLSNNS